MARRRPRYQLQVIPKRGVAKPRNNTLFGRAKGGNTWKQNPKAPKVSGVAPMGPSTEAPPAPSAPAFQSFLTDDSASSMAKARSIFSSNQQQGASLRDEQTDRSDLGEALRRMKVQQPKDQQATREGANRQGLFHSGHLGKQLDELATNYARQESDNQLQFDRRQSERLAGRQAITDQQALDLAGIDMDLLGRQIEDDSEAADGGYLVPNEPVTPVGGMPGVSAPRGGRPQPITRGRPGPRPTPKQRQVAQRTAQRAAQRAQRRAPKRRK